MAEVAKIQVHGTMDNAQAERVKHCLSKYGDHGPLFPLQVMSLTCLIDSAIRDWEWMVDGSKKSGSDPALDRFIITSSKPLEAALLKEYDLAAR